MTDRTTIVVSPRERFSPLIASLRSLFATVPAATRVVVVEGCSPPPIREQLAELQRRRPFELISLERFITPNEARNIGFARSAGAFTVFTDNDIVYEPGWLEHLEGNALRSGAAAVAPLICIGPPNATQAHHAGGDLIVEPGTRGPRLREIHRAGSQPVAAVDARIAPDSAEVIEFHCCLVANDFLRRNGPLDERLITREHLDFSLRAAIEGSRISFERRAIVTYAARGPFDPGDLRYYLFRWSEQLARQSVAVFMQSWGVELDERSIVDRWILHHRNRAIETAYADRLAELGHERFVDEVVQPITAQLVAEAQATRSEAPPPLTPPAPAPAAVERYFAAKIADRQGMRAVIDRLSAVPAAMPASADATQPARTGLRSQPQPGGDRRRMIVAGMAVSPDQSGGVRAAIASLLPQVDRLFIYLDGFERTPGLRHDKIVVLRSQEFGRLGAGATLFGALMCHVPTVFLATSPGSHYPPDYAASLVSALERQPQAALLGLEGAILARDLQSYRRGRVVTSRYAAVRNAMPVDTLAIDTVAFDPASFAIDPRRFAETADGDLQLALAAARQGLPRFVLARPAGWLKPAESGSAARTPAPTADDQAETELARQLLALGDAPRPAATTPIMAIPAAS